MIGRCRNCGKEFEILYPDQWVYSLGNQYFCTYSCVTEFENKEGNMRKITLEEKKQAVQIAIDGEDPRKFLKQCGSKNPDLMWGHIRAYLKENDPETFARLPGKIPRSDKGVKKVKPEEAPEVLEAPAAPKIYQPIVYNGMVVRELEIPFGRIRRSDVAGKTYLDFEPIDGADTLSFTDEQWRSFFIRFKDAAEGLGVEL